MVFKLKEDWEKEDWTKDKEWDIDDIGQDDQDGDND